MKALRLFSIASLGLAIASGLTYALVLPKLEKERHPVSFEGIQGDPQRGEYVLRMSGCVACHTNIDEEGEFMAGGAAIDTNFGKFYAPNITPDKQNGIGGWSLSDLYHSLSTGISPTNEHYYPVFPYTSYHGLRLQDIADLKAYLDTVPPSSIANNPHELKWPFSERRLLGFWKWLNFQSESPASNPTEVDKQRRGAYLVEGPGHCAECHSTRNLLGGIDNSSPLTGNQNGPDGNPVPAIAGPDAGINDWDMEDLVLYLQTGIEPDGDAAGGAMSEVIYESTSYLSDEDVQAIATYLLKSSQ